MRRKKLKPQKFHFIELPVDSLTTIYKHRGKPRYLLRLQRHKKSTLRIGLVNLKRNPDRVALFRSGSPGFWTVWYYKTNPEYVFIGSFGEWVNLPKDVVPHIIKALEKYLLEPSANI